MEDLPLKLSNLSPTLFLESRPEAYRLFSQGRDDEPDLYNPTSINEEISFKKELFSKLKFQYLEQETREKFLRAILENPPLYVEQSDIDKKIESNTELKRDLKQLKQKQKQLEVESTALASEVLELREVFQGKARATELMLEEIEEMEREFNVLTEANGVVSEYVKFERDYERDSTKNSSIGDEHGLVEYSMSGISKKLSKSMEKEDGKLSRLNSEFGLKQELLESHNRSIHKLETKLRQLEDEVENNKQVESGTSRILSKEQIYAQWVKEMTSVWETLYGERIDIEATGEKLSRKKVTITRKPEGKAVSVHIEEMGGEVVIRSDNGEELGREFSSSKGYEKVAKVISLLFGASQRET
ncbi:putative spindle pole body component Kre28p [[Candida] railenensis]|uniref:Spindle pole body component Kre28p n=1 Tax=[Candida] railenensis TaxID=45579 RepID=A0A9P0QRT4_9ASCO|nr:putative spindle pole body component Kre28p [[Candida] railenensis]